MSKTLRTILIFLGILVLVGVGYVIGRGLLGQAGQKTATFTVTVVAPSDYSIAISPASLTLTHGEVGTFTITNAPTGGFDSQIAYVVTGLPAGSYSFSVNPVSAGQTATLTINSAQMAVQAYTGTLTASEVAEQSPF